MGDAGDLAKLMRARVEGFARYAEWSASHPAHLSPADAVASIGALYELLPPESRRRPVDPSGVRRMHELLGQLSR